MTFIAVSAASGTINVTGNTLNTTGSTIRSTGSLICVDLEFDHYCAQQLPSNTVNIDRIGGIRVEFFTSSTNSPSMPSMTISSNNITFTSLAGTTSTTAISVLGGPTVPERRPSTATPSAFPVRIPALRRVLRGIHRRRRWRHTYRQQHNDQQCRHYPYWNGWLGNECGGREPLNTNTLSLTSNSTTANFNDRHQWCEHGTVYNRQQHLFRDELHGNY